MKAWPEGVARDRELFPFLSDIIESANDGIVTVDEEQTILMANPAAARIFRCPVADMVGAPLDRFIPQRHRESHRRDVRAFGEAGNAARHMGRTQEVIGLRTDDEEFPIDAAISCLNSGGRRLYTVILRDISERRFAEAELRESQARLQRVLTLLPEAVIISSGNRISFVNEAAERLLGAHGSTLLGRSASDLFQPDSVIVSSEHALALQKGRGVALVEERIVRADGSVRIGEVTAAPIDEHGEASILAVVRDVTDLRQTRSALAQSHADLQRLFTAQDKVQEDERSRIARELHDDLQQPLAAIRINARAIVDRVMGDPSSAVPLLAEIDRLASSAVESTRRIVNDLRPQMLEDLGLASALEMLARQFSQRSGIACSFVAQGELDDALLDSPTTATCLYRVAQEALNNVVKHSRSSTSTVRLARAADGRLALRISDNGVGMGAADRHKSQSFGLLGMQERVRAVGGLLRIDSQAGVGTSVEVLVPARVPRALPMPALAQSKQLVRPAPPTEDRKASGPAPPGDGRHDASARIDDRNDERGGDRADDRSRIAGTAQQQLIDALPANVAILDGRGVIQQVNRAWLEFGKYNGDPGGITHWPGVDYLDACRRSVLSDRFALPVLEGLAAILDGTREALSIEYPCHAPDEQRWFRMDAARMADGRILVTHTALASWGAVRPVRSASSGGDG